MDERPTRRRGPLDWSLRWIAKRSWKFWGITLILLPVAYVGSLGHVYRLLEAGLIPLCMEPPLVHFYRPVFWLTEDGPEPLRSIADWWVSICRHLI